MSTYFFWPLQFGIDHFIASQFTTLQVRFERCRSQTHVKIISTDALMRRGIIGLSPLNVKLFVPRTSKSLLVQYSLTAVDRILNPQSARI